MPTGLLTHPLCAAHEMGRWHPECPARLSAIHDQLIVSGLTPFLEHIDAPPASLEDIIRAHDPEYVERLRSRVPEHGYVPLDPDTAMNPSTWQAALHAAGAVVEAIDRVVDGALANAFCAVRPPGHHARPDAAMGFCVLNNVAIGALHALEVQGLERVAIIDFDVHHGNGTEEIFAGDERVLMASFFQHPFYPYSGTEHPAKNMVNVPLPAGTDGVKVRAVVDEIWMPRLRQFEPELIVISAGFDAHREDDLGQMGLVESDYAFMTERLMELASRYSKGRVVGSLEGGYNLSALGRSVVAHMRVLARI